jgi:hypothetical protein
MRRLSYAVLSIALVAATPGAAQQPQPKPQFIVMNQTRAFNGQRSSSDESDIDTPPAGYTTCTAHLVKTLELADNMNFNARIVRYQQVDGPAWTASVQIGAPGWMRFTYEVTYVLADPKAVVELTKKACVGRITFAPFKLVTGIQKT